MHDETMTIDDFEAHLDRHGAAIERWPAAAAQRARKLLATSSDARARLKRAGTLDALLDEAMAVATLTTPAVRARILAEVGRRAARPALWSWFAEGMGMRGPVDRKSVV